MSVLKQEMIDFCVTAYGCLKDDASDRACFIEYSSGSERYINYILQKKSYYFHNWALFEGNTYFMSIEEDLLMKWYKDKHPKSEDINKTQV